MSRVLLWFRRDLRLTDNPALQAALQLRGEILPLYIHAPGEEQPWPPGAASRWWLHQSLQALQASLQARGSRLLILEGPTAETLRTLIRREGITHLFWNRLYDPALVARDSRLKQELRQAGIECRSFNAALLFEPWEIANRSQKPFRVFTPFWRSCQQRLVEVAVPARAPARLPAVASRRRGLGLDALQLLPGIPWDQGLYASWSPGEAGALKQVKRFLRSGVRDYASARDLPDRPGTSRLSPHLHFGEIGPRQLLYALRSGAPGHPAEADGAGHFLRELGWREFAHHLLHHFPHTESRPLNPRFEGLRWVWGKQRPAALRAWQRGRTGIPIVDAGMRELWHTGWMHNRVRMIVASLLTKNLGIHWLEGARWFWDTLVDADLPGNSLGWQWTAGCGADAAPYHRVFNPVRQGERFDPQGRYVRRWVPELAGLPDSRLHAPWTADGDTLAAAGVRLGGNYPSPIVDLQGSRAEALERWHAIR